jgi:osmotically-inducible protein OsmY
LDIQKGTITMKPSRSDDAIRDDLFFELKWDPKINSSDIAVGVKDGVVTLSGFVPSYWEKLEAEKAVKRVYGVKAVANDLEANRCGNRPRHGPRARAPRQHTR